MPDSEVRSIGFDLILGLRKRADLQNLVSSPYQLMFLRETKRSVGRDLACRMTDV